jgi:hypothetical protein
MKTTLETRIINALWTTRRSLEGLRLALGIPHDDLMTLVTALAGLLKNGKVRFWGNTNERIGQETLYIAA